MSFSRVEENDTVPETGLAGSPDRPDTAAIAERLQHTFGSRFQVLRPIAIGGMATIFQLRHRLHGGLSVAKVLHPELARRPGILRSFRAEATHAARLGGHPNAVPIFDFGDLDGLFFLLMPFVEGEDLDQLLLRRGPLGRAEALQLGSQISSLLSHAEAQGIVHCDLTPGNIRLDTFGHYRLLDFGISLSANVTERPFTGGTPLYTSPEQLGGCAPDIRSDLYSLGAVMAEVLTGVPLFLDTSLEAIRRRHVEGDWQMPAVLAANDPLAVLLRRLLAVDPKQRIGSAFELSGILDAFGFRRPEFRSIPVQAAGDPGVASPRRRLS